ncbi:MerR family transcriptional regulator [Gayadomonas joobiniege]|uniref:MerR family transcriptional regulator n=1 Tax=Gayadomonas joobiniege TaxID=1234606 RepID=UPI00035C5384|nr:MerR family transcriptional regulator [Gayadomonas joobiniege]
MKKQSSLTIGGVAKAANVGVETIRFYERKAIISQPPKTDGFRYYSDEYVKKIRLVKKLQEIGFSLAEIKEFFTFDACCSHSRQVIQQKSKAKAIEIRQKIADLKVALEAIERFQNSCGSNKDATLECELLECFENNWACCESPQLP